MLILLMAKALRDRVLRVRTDGASTDVDTTAKVGSNARRARAEADEVREMAAGYVRHDPTFADELYAAAELHEQLAAEKDARLAQARHERPGREQGEHALALERGAA